MFTKYHLNKIFTFLNLKNDYFKLRLARISLGSNWPIATLVKTVHCVHCKRVYTVYQCSAKRTRTVEQGLDNAKVRQNNSQLMPLKEITTQRQGAVALKTKETG